jgi:hypothetical protein
VGARVVGEVEFVDEKVAETHEQGKGYTEGEENGYV